MHFLTTSCFICPISLHLPDNIQQSEEGQYVPFLDTEISIDSDGDLLSRYYRKPQKKNITLHQLSHHPENTKTEVIKNFYRTAEEVSIGPGNTEYSCEIVDNLLRRNGYSNPRSVHQTAKNNRVKTAKNQQELTPLRIGYVSEQVSNKIRNYIKRSKLPIRPIFLPGNKLRTMFVKSRPWELGYSKVCAKQP